MKEILHLTICLILIISAIISAFSSSPVESVLYLIFSFYLSACILFIFNVDFLGLTYVVVYVGAVAVLFLFIIMMLDIKSKQSFFVKNQFLAYALIAIFMILVYFVFSLFLSDIYNTEILLKNNLVIDYLSNIEVFGQVLYNYFTAYFLIAGILLLIALVGCICITKE